MNKCLVEKGNSDRELWQSLKISFFMQIYKLIKRFL